MHLNGTKSKEELFNDVYGQIQNKIEELLNTQVYVQVMLQLKGKLFKTCVGKYEAVTQNMFTSIFLFRNKLLLILVSEDNSCLLHAVYLTASKFPASVKTQLPNSTLFNLSLEN